MEQTMKMNWKENFHINSNAIQFVNKIENKLIDRFYQFDRIREKNQWKVLNAFHQVRLAATDFHWSTGYGYGDIGREKIEKTYATIFCGEDALVRPSIASGTHALALTMQGILIPGDEMIYISGTPYDTMQTVIGLTKNEQIGRAHV